MTPTEDFNNAVFFLFPVLFVLGGVVLVIVFARSRLKEREMLHRERLAMIEKGLLPPPDTDPVRFERLAGPAARPLGTREARYRSAGIVFIGLGVALTLLLAFTAGVPEVGLGIGGALAALGVAFFAIGVLPLTDKSHLSAPSVRRQDPPGDGPLV